MLQGKWAKAACLGLAFWLTACSGSGGDKPEQVAERFVEKSYSGDADAVVKMIHIPKQDADSAGVEEMVTGKVKAAVAEQAARAESLGGVAEITSEPAQITDGEPKLADVVTHTRFKQSDKVKSERVRLIETEQGWKIRL